MGIHKKLFVKKRVSDKELRAMIRKEKNSRILKRLIFINQLYIKDGVYDACDAVGTSKATGYTCLEQWNEKGYEGLIPQTGGGRHPKLNEKQRKELKDILASKKDNWLTSEVRALIRKEFNVDYSLRQVARILRSFKMHYSKPYPKDYRRPENAKEMLKERLHEAVKDKKGSSYILGFIDEASPQTTDNKQRFWSFGKSGITKNTTKYRANTFGFYAANGKSVVDFKENSKQESVCEFLQTMRARNPGKPIVAVLDNFKSHTAKKTRKYAESLDIILVFLPTYSPNLNPIEQIWRAVRRRISQIFIKSQWSFTETIKTTFYRLARKQSFVTGWLETFQPNLV